MILYAVRRYLGFSQPEWDDLTWDLRRAYLEGLSDDETVPFAIEDNASAGAFPQGMQPNIRRADAGTDVIDLAAMREELEAGRRKAGSDGV